MESQHARPSVRFQPSDKPRQALFQSFQLPVDFNADRLKGFLGAGVEAVFCGNALLHNVSELPAGADTFFGADGGDPSYDGRRERLFSVFSQNAQQRALFVLVYHDFGGERRAVVHPHIQRRVVAHIGESAFARIDLMGRDPEVEQESVDLLHARVRKRFGVVFEIGAVELESSAERFQPLCRFRDRFAVLVGRDQADRRVACEDREGMSASARSAVEVNAAVSDVQPFQHLVHHDRAMIFAHDSALRLYASAFAC